MVWFTSHQIYEVSITANSTKWYVFTFYISTQYKKLTLIIKNVHNSKLNCAGN